MGDLTHKAIDDLKAQLAAAQEEANQQRTRAEAAEQELRAAKSRQEIESRVLWACWEWFDDHDDRKTSAEIYYELKQVVGEWHGVVHEASGISDHGAAGLAAKLARIRAHLQGVDMEKEQRFFEIMQKVTARATEHLLAAAREALEP